MIYDRNRGVKSIQHARKTGDRSELLLNGSAMFNLVDGKITHNTTYAMRNTDTHYLYITSDTYPVYENNQFVGYYSNSSLCEPRGGVVLIGNNELTNNNGVEDR